MAHSRWQTFSPWWNSMGQLQLEMNRLFDRVGNGGTNRGATAVFPVVNIWDDGDQVFVEAELPGIDPSDLEIHVTGGDQLTLKGERKQHLPESTLLHRQERGFGSFARVLTLPFQVNSEKVEAGFENGVLTIKLAKHEAAKPRKIVVKS